MLWIGRQQRNSIVTSLAVFVVVGGTGLYAVAFTHGIYGMPDPRLRASHWLEVDSHPGTTITRDQYEPYLPIQITTDHSLGGRPWYPFESLQWHAADTPEKVHRIVQQLSKADYMLITSRRIHYFSLNHPDLFPVNARFYQQLFAGTSSLREVARWQPVPQLGPWRWDRPAPEHTFDVFDHPTVIIYERTPAFDPAALEADLLARLPR
jgi:hypothetical protein